MKTTPEQLADEAALVDNLASEGDDHRAAALDRIACRLLEHVTGVEQVPTYRTTGELPRQRSEAIEKLALEHRNIDGGTLRSVTLSPQLAGGIAIQLADFAEGLHHATRRRRMSNGGIGR